MQHDIKLTQTHSSNRILLRCHAWNWPAGGLGLAAEWVQSVVGEAGGSAHLLSDQGELTAQTGYTAAIPRL